MYVSIRIPVAPDNRGFGRDRLEDGEVICLSERRRELLLCAQHATHKPENQAAELGLHAYITPSVVRRGFNTKRLEMRARGGEHPAVAATQQARAQTGTADSRASSSVQSPRHGCNTIARWYLAGKEEEEVLCDPSHVQRERKPSANDLDASSNFQREVSLLPASSSLFAPSKTDSSHHGCQERQAQAGCFAQ